jgi:arsenate reductase
MPKAMIKKNRFDKELQEVALFAKALSHPARLKILQYLSESKTCISGDISDCLPLSRSTVSQHLNYLKRQNLIKGTIDGIKTNYCLNGSVVRGKKETLESFFNKLVLSDLACDCEQDHENMKILILCTGNSCRSQMAQGFLQSFDRRLTVCSAGTQPASHVNPIAVEVMKEMGIDISSHSPAGIDKYLTDKWDYVITVCDNANETCPVFTGKVEHRLHMGFEDPSGKRGTPEYILDEFRRIRDQIKEKFYKLYLKEIQQKL